jgi:hypothetical protein
MKSNGWETALLNLYFANANAANIGDATGLRGSTGAGSLYISLHTAYPGEAGVQNTSEAAYTGYARVAVARSGAGWTVSGNQVTNAALIAFPAATGGSETEFFAGVGRQVSGATELDYIAPMGTELGEGDGFSATDIITIPGLSGVAVDDRIAFFALPKDALPTGITAGTVYWVKTVSGNDITISTTQGGATLDITAAGGVLAYKMIGLAVSNGITPQVAIGQLSVKEE